MAPESADGDAEVEADGEADGDAEQEVEGEAERKPDCKHRLLTGFCMLWAAAVGISVPLEMVNTIFLNSYAAEADAKYHAFYVSSLAIAMGAVELIPISVRASKPIAKPRRWWHLLGGVCSLPAFFTISAGSILGTQVVLVVQLAALLTSFFVIDIVGGMVKLSEYPKVLALLVIFTGVVLESFGSGKSASGGFQALILLPLVAVTGIGFALQSKCNNALAEDLGSSARATVVSACVNLFCSVPINLYIYFGLDVSPSVHKDCWYLWIVAGFQSAFYVGSMAYIPRVLGFTRCYVITLTAKLSVSLFIDSEGLSGEVVPVTMTRVAALIIVLLGSIVFNFGTTKDTSRHILFADSCADDELDGAETAQGGSLFNNGTGKESSGLALSNECGDDVLHMAETVEGSSHSNSRDEM